ncbi:type I-G CRISPR-associated protein, Cas3-extension family [Alicyclobacillus acidiphilus]|uniref:type I-G CRISPR-associated protein, Cas3-extension family n=1 Tax=Alicyclobacillus acidiphilus TaxID=182455 RepID=UPI0008304088|nr:hypothetical protein [Alicyclobacillus acidiphilus]
MKSTIFYRLDGFEADNLLAFFALLGLLRALEAFDQKMEQEKRLYPRVSWSDAPVYPVLHVSQNLSREEVAERAADGIALLAGEHQFGDHLDLDYVQKDARALLCEAARSADCKNRYRADLLAALMSDGAVKDDKKAKSAVIDPTPICLLFGGGHQHFLDRLARVPNDCAPPQRGRGKSAVTLSPAECLAEALYSPWHRKDPTFSFRWDPEEAVRYALMAGDPTDVDYKVYTQHGANRLAAIGISTLTVAPRTRGGRVRAFILGGYMDGGEFAFAWPIWRPAISLAAVRGLLGHPGLWEENGLTHLDVVNVFVARRIQVARLMNFTRGVPLSEWQTAKGERR